MFLQSRFKLNLDGNRPVVAFLHKLEYFDGILFLTTNLVNDFDAAILNRIHLKMKYENLDKKERKAVMTRFLERQNGCQGLSSINDQDVDCFANLSLNGREVSLSMRARRS